MHTHIHIDILFVIWLLYFSCKILALQKVVSSKTYLYPDYAALNIMRFLQHYYLLEFNDSFNLPVRILYQ